MIRGPKMFEIHWFKLIPEKTSGRSSSPETWRNFLFGDIFSLDVLANFSREMSSRTKKGHRRLCENQAVEKTAPRLLFLII